jgi:hypothetical protein
MIRLMVGKCCQWLGDVFKRMLKIDIVSRMAPEGEKFLFWP